MTTVTPDVDNKADLGPVELDPPNPAIARWQELADRDITVVHDDDAEKVIGFPRPAWADPDEDDIGTSAPASFYRSSYVSVASMTSGGENVGGELYPAHVKVSARIHGDADLLIGILVNRFISGEWREFGTSLPPAAAVELAEVLLAAVDLVGGVK